MGRPRPTVDPASGLGEQATTCQDRVLRLTSLADTNKPAQGGSAPNLSGRGAGFQRRLVGSEGPSLLT